MTFLLSSDCSTFTKKNRLRNPCQNIINKVAMNNIFLFNFEKPLFNEFILIVNVLLKTFIVVEFKSYNKKIFNLNIVLVSQLSRIYIESYKNE